MSIQEKEKSRIKSFITKRKPVQVWLLVVAMILLLAACTKIEQDKVEQLPVEITPTQEKQSLVNETGDQIETRILPPAGFERVPVEEGSFGEYLRNLPLKPHDAPVLYYNGDIKRNRNVYTAVVDMEIGDRNLQQCADAVMRLRGEYLYKKGAYDEIHFNFTNGFRVDYSQWMKGYRVVIEGNESHWEKKAQPSNTYEDFRRYMNIIFAYAGTLSLEKELIPVESDKMEIGDVFIQGGNPGHAVIVVDMVENQATGERLFLLAQSYMPAQETQILVNRNDENSPWYSLDFGEQLSTPEWSFTKKDLKRFP